ncbi:hypothetical protein [Sphingobacterium sp. JB170]|uniref:hypothetical protein n=1 Tax=Sphingobacterium sp. JB170 TaxID=1434842 RepID=UPI00097EF881|nr:hypothetical protein [Sphingobacterium sp. JB170]SJN46296.1 hypothetical protein FM107_14300 [Sphingobacterium sp. JB170]
MPENQYYIDKCKELIEVKLGWGNSADWQSQDFENLSDQIFIETKTIISASTLKRIWGKVQYKSKPNLGTLDTLARFISHQNWRDFVKSCSKEAISDSPSVSLKSTVTKSASKYYRLLLILVLTVFLVGFFLQMKTSNPLQFNNLKFESRTVTVGVPNTVIFNYDASKSNADSVFIQQNWDETRRVRVDKFHHEHASVYYLPGYYRAKLVLNDSIVKEHDVFIESEDWLGVLSRDSIPFYFPKEIYNHGDWYGISQKELNQDLNDYNIEIPSFILTHVNQSLIVDSRSFSLSLNVQNTFEHPASPCRRTDLILLGTVGAIIIPLSKPGCVGETKLRIGDLFMDGKYHDMSAFGVDYSSPVKLECSADSGIIEIKLNNEIAYEGRSYKGIGNIVGVRIKFQGAGRFDSFKLTKTS